MPSSFCEVKNSIESFLSAVAVNGRPIEPTHSPKANVGDVITFQFKVQNRMIFPLFDIKTVLDWDTGLIFDGNMDRENMKGQFDELENEISLSIPEHQAAKGECRVRVSFLFEGWLAAGGLDGRCPFRGYLFPSKGAKLSGRGSD